LRLFFYVEEGGEPSAASQKTELLFVIPAKERVKEIQRLRKNPLSWPHLMRPSMKNTEPYVAGWPGAAFALT
jgi:hypothetical protein